MKKLLLMFVMLLGSVATMQAQTFDFSCSTAPLYGFTGEEVDRLDVTDFEDNNGNFQIAYADGSDYVIIDEFNGQFDVYSDSDDSDLETVDTFVEAIALAYEFAGLPHGTVAVGGINFDTISYDYDNPLVGQIGATFSIVLSTTQGVADSVHPADIVYSLQASRMGGATIDGNILSGTIQANGATGRTEIGVYASSLRTGQSIYGRVHINGTN